MTLSGRFFRLFLPVLLYMTVIFLLSSSSRISPPFADRLSFDKIYHVIEYAVLGYLLLRALEQGFYMQGVTMIILAFGIGAAFGMSDELHQYFVPGRIFSYWDFAADTVGVAVGEWIYLKLRL